MFKNGSDMRDARARPSWTFKTALESFENETLGGNVTYEKIWDVLKQDLVENDSS